MRSLWRITLSQGMKFCRQRKERLVCYGIVLLCRQKVERAVTLSFLTSHKKKLWQLGKPIEFVRESMYIEMSRDDILH